MGLQPIIAGFKNRIGSKMQEFLKIKCELQEEVKNFNDFLRDEINPKFTPSEIAQALLWLETVHKNKILKVEKKRRRIA